MSHLNHFVFPMVMVLVMAIGLPVNADDAAASISAALIEATHDDDAEIRRAAYQVLKRASHTEAIKQAFHDGLDDQDPKVQRIALDGYVQQEGPTNDVIRLLVTRLSGDRSIAPAAQQHLVKIGEAAVPQVIDLVKSVTKQPGEHVSAKKRAIQTLGTIATGVHRDRVVEVLIAATKAPEQPVRLEAINALGNIQWNESPKSDRLYRYASALVKRFDKNADGVLTDNELDSKRGRFFIDTNNDGKITSDEVLNGLKARNLGR